MGDEDTRYRSRAVHDEPLGRMGRRRFVNTLAGLGFGALSASLLTADDVRAASSDEVPIVYGLTRDGTSEGDGSGGGPSGGGVRPRRKTVPADWYDDFRSAVAAHRNLDVIHHESVASSAVAPGEYGGANATIHVDITAEEVRGAVPERVRDTPVEVRRVERTRERELDADPAALRSGAPAAGEGVPGSVAVASDDLYGTLAPAMRDPKDGALYFATANHVFGGTGNGGESLYLLDDGRTEIGSVREGYPKSDVVCASPKAGYEPLHRIRDGDPGRVLGQFTKAGLADLKAAGEKLEKIGVKTGHTKGKIQAVDGVTCAYGAICKRGQLKWGEESGFGDGDSGSVNYHPDPDDPEAGVLVGGFNNARTWWPGEDYIWGTAAHHVTNKHGYTF
ncbi:hypothetical protein M0R89_20120 (plasmid) [Halorussus limi]|uniref:Uncharacterized protein n=1 Tax=Halorussus limi TaxID=2938695 RepID=A0A8U0HZM0_9EURY|nr:hypothetical protein [Halorussus limi]UPV76470.1 hypothetical protein M0R89_20120 [Halorussus limi]